MAIPRKQLVVASTSTHFPNETTQAAEGPAAKALNHQEPEMLSEPDADEGGSTHFQNNQPNTKESRKVNASGSKPKKAKTKAGIDDFDGESDADAVEGPDADADFPAGDEDAVEATMDDDCCEVGQQDTQHMPNDEDPAAGYLTTGGELPEEFEDNEFEAEDDEVDASDAELEDNSGSTPQSLLEVDDDWDTEAGVVHAEFEDEEEEVEEEPEDTEEEIEVASGDDSMDLVDVDGMEDEGDDVEFATAGLKVWAIKANRIVATLNKKTAVAAGHGDVYLSDQFQDVVGIEMSKHGLRAGLRNMGFALAKVNLASNAVLNKRVEAKTKKVTAAIRRNSQSTNAAMQQCLAIAAVGINRHYFKDTRNELRAALEEELVAAGVRNGQRLVRRIFASKGVEYAKAILMLANKLSDMPEVTRNHFASALDLTNDGEIDDDEEFGDSASPDFQSETIGSDEEEFDDDMEDELESPNTVSAALANPQYKKTVTAKKAGYSLTATAVLNGDVPFPFLNM